MAKNLSSYRKCAGVLKPRRARMCHAGAFAIGRFGGSRCRGGSYGFCLCDSKIVRLWECQSRGVSEDSLAFGPQPKVSRQVLDIGLGGWFRAVTVDRDTKAIGVSDSVRVSGLGDRLGRVKANPLVYELGSVPSRKRFHSQHGGATLRTTEACGRTWRTGLGSGWPRMIQQ